MICVRCGVEIEPYVLEWPWEGRPAGTTVWRGESDEVAVCDWMNSSSDPWRDDELHAPKVETVEEMLVGLRVIKDDLR